MAKKWQVFYNSGEGWRAFANKVDTKAKAERIEAEAREGSKRLGDGWKYEIFVVEE